MADLAGDGATEYAARLQAALRDPMFTDLDLPKLQSEDVATNFPGMTEAFLRLYTAYQEEQLAPADRDAETPRGGDGNARRTDAVAEARRFLTARRNSFPALDEAAAALAATVAAAGGFAPYIEARHDRKSTRLPLEDRKRVG